MTAPSPYLSPIAGLWTALTRLCIRRLTDRETELEAEIAAETALNQHLKEG